MNLVDKTETRFGLYDDLCQQTRDINGDSEKRERV